MKHIKTNLFLSLGAITLLASQGYMWSHDTSYTETASKLSAMITTYVDHKKDEAVLGVKNQVKDLYQVGLEKIGVSSQKNSPNPSTTTLAPEAKTTEKTNDIDAQKLAQALGISLKSEPKNTNLNSKNPPSSGDNDRKTNTNVSTAASLAPSAASLPSTNFTPSTHSNSSPENKNFNPTSAINISNALNTDNLASPSKVIYKLQYAYDHTGAPKNLSEKETLDILNLAAKRWEKSCGVAFEFIGFVKSDFIAVDEYSSTESLGYGVVRWGELSRDKLAQASMGDGSAPMSDFIMDLNTYHFDKKKIDKSLLESTMTHELGHVLALPHSRIKDSIMNYRSQNMTPYLNEGDVGQCQENVQSWMKNPENQKFKM